MKKLIFLSATAIMLFATTNAQTDVAYIKNDKAALRHEKSIIKKEKMLKNIIVPWTCCFIVSWNFFSNVLTMHFVHHPL